jgi:hypothetical protein
VPKNPECRHPFVALASAHVNLSEARLDQLFKSDAFKHAAEPLFDTSHVDSQLNILEVFPTFVDDASLYNALIYATLQSHYRGVPSLETCQLQAQSIACINKSLVDGEAPSVASILCLRGAAYKWENVQTYYVHSAGLSKVLESCQPRLTPAAVRAIFWQDLFAAELVQAPRKLSHDILPDKVSWNTHGTDKLPTGFSRCRNLLPGSLVDCVMDCLDLQNAVLNQPVTQRERYALLDTMQANLESRLTSQMATCDAFGLVAAAIRVATFIICYTAWMDTWSCPLIPSRLASRLLELLEPSLAFSDADSPFEAEIWHGRYDLHLWLLLVGIGAAGIGETTDMVYGRYKNALAVCKDVYTSQRGSCTRDLGGISTVLQAATNDFLLPVSNSKASSPMRKWFDAEFLLKGHFS